MSGGTDSFDEKFRMFQDPQQAAALQAQVRVSQKQINEGSLGMSRSLSVSGGDLTSGR